MNPKRSLRRGDLAGLALEWTRLLWDARLWKESRWMGVPVRQWATDLLIFQEIVERQRPDVIIETGTALGGSACFFASLLELLGRGQVVSIDIERNEAARKAVASQPFVARVAFLTGDSRSPEIAARVRELVKGQRNVLVLLDSDHSREHVRAELEVYHPFIPVGGHLIVADTICRELATLEGQEHFLGDNPLDAVEDFLAAHPEFEADRSWEKFLVTFCPGGFLRRVR